MSFNNLNHSLLPPRLASGLLVASCIGILCAMIVAGFSPFTSHPPNEVRWVKNGKGLIFGEYAAILSSAPLGPPTSRGAECGVELWMQPGVIADSNTMLAFYIPDRELQFSIEQVGDGVVLARKPARSTSSIKSRQIYLHNVLRQDTPLLITITADARATAVYLDGTFRASSSQFGLSRSDLSGQIVIGNSPFANSSWGGVLYGLGVYDRDLTGDEVRANYGDWTKYGKPQGLDKEKALALFNFSEGSGSVVHNQIADGPSLTIPSSYFVLRPVFLEPFWRSGIYWGDWKDGLINFFGFLALGLFLCPMLGRYMTVKAAILVTIITGCLLSLSIEITQYYLPTRDSDSRDLISNCLGTIFGAAPYGLTIVRKLLARIGVVHARPAAEVVPAGQAASALSVESS